MIEGIVELMRSAEFWVDAGLMWLTLICFVGAAQELRGMIADRRAGS